MNQSEKGSKMDNHAEGADQKLATLVRCAITGAVLGAPSQALNDTRKWPRSVMDAYAVEDGKFTYDIAPATEIESLRARGFYVRKVYLALLGHEHKASELRWD